MSPAPGCRFGADLAGRKQFGGTGLKCGCSCLSRQPKRKRSRSLAFRADTTTKKDNPQPHASSRLLRNRREHLEQRQQQQTERLQEQDTAPAVPSRSSLSKRANGRLLERSRVDSRLAGRFRHRQEPAGTQGSDPTEQQQTTRQTDANDVSIPSQQQKATLSAGSKPHATMRKFSSGAGKLSQKDWQVTTDWLTVDMEDGLLDEGIWQDLLTQFGLRPSVRPQATLFHQLGMTKADFHKILKTRSSDGLLQLRVPTIQNKFRFFKTELNFKDDDIRKLLVKCPRVMEHKLEGTMRPHLEFLQQYGVAKNDLGKVVSRAPEFFQLSIDDTLQPRLAFLKEQLGITDECLAKIILKLPSVLTYTNSFMQKRLDFLRDSGLPLEAIAKAVVSHPQVLHYLPDSMQEKISYLNSIGMGREQISQTIQRLPQLLSLDVRHNLNPKWRYLESQLGGTVRTLCTYPAYFSLSLPSRIIPRHRYLQMVRAEPLNPFPISYLKLTDDKFAQNVAHRPLAQYTTFRDQVAAGYRPRPRLL